MREKHEPADVEVPSREEIVREVTEIVAEYTTVPADEIVEAATLEVDLGMDSLDIAETVMEIEERFDVHVPDEVSPGPLTVAALVDGVLRLLAEARSR